VAPALPDSHTVEVLDPDLHPSGASGARRGRAPILAPMSVIGLNRTMSAPGADRGSLLHRLHVGLVGRHPRLRPWHHQWLVGTPLYRVLQPLLATLQGDVLDVGCGYKPYRAWLPGAREYYGIDVFPGPEVDALIEPGEAWPVAGEAYDVVLCTQVLEHVGDLHHTVGELRRALRPGADAVITVPWIYGEHNAPHDYRRLSQHGLRRLLADHDLEIVALTPHGAIGSTLGGIFLSWTFDAMRRTRATTLLTAPLLPLWTLMCWCVNVVGIAADRLDRTGMYYGNLLVHARRPLIDTPAVRV
jgi:SAM-dependent methyltransferase